MDSDDGTAAAGDDGLHLPLLNLSKVRSRLDHVQRLLSTSLTTNTVIGKPQMELVSMEITSAIHQAIANGTALISASQLPISNPPPPPPPLTSKSDLNFSQLKQVTELGFPKTEVFNDETGQDWDIVELDAVELLAEHLHFCNFCGKGFKRDANLRMHMRAHGNKFKTLEALSKPEGSVSGVGSGCGNGSGGGGRTRFSCPFAGCGRNKMHKKFRPLKSVICVKNHFKRSHCPKMYSCNRCNKKNFSVLADLKSHLKHCGDTKWRCSCGTSFSRKDKLFGHMALFEGHMPAVPEEVAAVADEDGKAKGVVENGGGKGIDWVDKGMDDGFFDGLLDGLGSFGDDFCIPDVFGGSSNVGSDWSL